MRQRQVRGATEHFYRVAVDEPKRHHGLSAVQTAPIEDAAPLRSAA